MQRIIKPKNQRVKRALDCREPKLHENTKTAIFIRGGNTSETVTQALKDLYSLKKPAAKLFRRKNITRPFEDASSIEFFSRKNDASLFLFGSHSRKRPHNLIIGRLFDFHILDMVELGILKFHDMGQLKAKGCVVGSKPCMLFSGDLFETDLHFIRLKNLFIDFFRGEEVTKIRLGGLDHVMSFVAHDEKIFLRIYRIILLKSGGRLPRIELEEMGPSFDLEVRRSHLASEEVYKKACRQPRANKIKNAKNVSRDVFGTKLGRVHMQRQDFSKLQIRKIKGLKQSKKTSTLT